MSGPQLGNPVDAGAGRDAYARLIEAFGKAWESGLPAGMAEVFSVDGALIPAPQDEPLRGRAAIAQYWRDVPLEQAEVSFRFGEIFVAGPWFSTEFKCTFRRIRTGEWVEIGGALFCESSDGKISEMRMYWHRGAAGR